MKWEKLTVYSRAPTGALDELGNEILKDVALFEGVTKKAPYTFKEQQMYNSTITANSFKLLIVTKKDLSKAKTCLYQNKNYNIVGYTDANKYKILNVEGVRI